MYKTIFLIIVTVVFSLTTIILAHDNSDELLKIRITKESLTKDAQKEVECLADNIFFEAAYEPIEGQAAVAIVTFNRVKSNQFPNTICDVVKQKTRVSNIGDRRIVCQFSWYCQTKEYFLSYNKENLTGRQKEVYNNIYDLAFHLYVNSHKITDNTGGALFYHADYVNPKWRNLDRTTKIGRHIFYKPGEVDGKYDAEIKLRTEGRFSLAFVLPTDGRY